MYSKFNCFSGCWLLLLLLFVTSVHSIKHQHWKQVVSRRQEVIILPSREFPLLRGLEIPPISGVNLSQMSESLAQHLWKELLSHWWVARVGRSWSLDASLCLPLLDHFTRNMYRPTDPCYSYKHVYPHLSSVLDWGVFGYLEYLCPMYK